MLRRLFLIAGACAGLLLLWLLAVWPPPVWYRSHWPRETAFMTRPHAHPQGRTPGDRRYRPVPLDSISPHLQDAVVIGEDANFFSHSGIDYLALAQAIGYPRRAFAWSDHRDRRDLLAVLPRAWSRRDRLRGASTITQQLAKNLYLSPSRNPLRKLKEAVTAWRLEAALGKRRIMELYLNVVELGDEVWGAEAASEAYFKRHAAGLSQEQAAALAGALPFPLRSNPSYRPGRMRWRQNLILRRMRGEEVEVPKVEEEDVVSAPSVIAPDSLPWRDSLAPLPPESLPPSPAPFDSFPPPTDSTAAPAPVDSGDSADSAAGLT